MSEITVRTALDLSVEEWSRYDPAGALIKRQAEMRKAVSLRRRRAIHLTHQAADLLRTSYAASRVILFGSLAKKHAFTLWSDIDLAVSGIQPDKFYAAVAVITGMSKEFKIDLVDIETCGIALRSAIEQEGIQL